MMSSFCVTLQFIKNGKSVRQMKPCGFSSDLRAKCWLPLFVLLCIGLGNEEAAAQNAEMPSALKAVIQTFHPEVFVDEKAWENESLLSKYFFYEKAWVSSLIVLVLSQLVDIQYFDGRISLAFWILLAGSRNIISE